jgi:hypothetical protein
VPEGFYGARAGGRTRRAGPEGRLPHDVVVRPRREAQLAVTTRSTKASRKQATGG